MNLLLSVLALAVAEAPPPPAAEAALIARSTSKSTDEFAECFVSLQTPELRPYWHVLHEDGSRFGNEGAVGVANPYWIRFTEGQGQNMVKVYLARQDGSERRLLDAVSSCA